MVVSRRRLRRDNILCGIRFGIQAGLALDMRFMDGGFAVAFGLERRGLNVSVSGCVNSVHNRLILFKCV
jgi:hypothetical protein